MARDTESIMAEFASLSNQLSPENLSCDGELTHAQIRAKGKKLWARWNELEQEIGRPMTEYEVDTWSLSQPKK